MNDSPADSGSPLGRSEESLSESHQAESTTSGASATESTQTLTNPTNGSSPRKIEANRRNSKKSTGPKTSLGKAISSWNSMRHGLLSKTLPAIYGQDKEEFTRLFASLHQDLEPVGTLEEVLVEKIAQEYWRLCLAAEYETKEFVIDRPFATYPINKIVRYQTAINRQLYQAIKPARENAAAA